MTETVLTAERILVAAEDVLRRHGPSKATVVDVARVLDVSHGSVYRHFPSKAALRDAVTERWLARVSEPLHQVLASAGPAPVRLRRWFDTLIAQKRAVVFSDPELFATYQAIAAEARDVIAAHVEEMIAQVADIIEDGVVAGDFAVDDHRAAALAVWNATTRFHNPAHAQEWGAPGADAAFDGVWSLVLRGLGYLRVPAKARGPRVAPVAKAAAARTATRRRT